MKEKVEFRDIFSNSKEKLLCLEVNPPIGTDCDKIFKRLDKCLEGLDFFNITDSALAKMRMSAIPFAYILKEKFNTEPLINMSCRDRNLIALQGDILSCTMLGLNSIIALTGDAVSVGDEPDRKGVFEVNSIGLLNMIAKLNSGETLAGKKLDGCSSITPGVVVNPNAKNYQAEIRKLEKKKKAGAVYALSQPVFDIDVAKTFFKEASIIGLPIFLGLLPIKTGQGAMAINKIPGIKVSQTMLDMAEKDPKIDLSNFSFDLCSAIIDAVKDYVCGYHIISGANPNLGLELLEKVKQKV